MGGGCALSRAKRKTVVFYDLIELKKAKFQLLCDKCRLKKAILI